MSRRTTLVIALLVALEVDRRLTAGRRHSELLAAVDSLDRIGSSQFATSDEGAKQELSSSSPPAPVVGVLLGPRSGKIAVVRADGSRSIRSTPIDVFSAVADIAATAGVDVAEVEAGLMARKPGVREFKHMPPAIIQRGAQRLVELVLTSPFDGGAR